MSKKYVLSFEVMVSLQVEVEADSMEDASQKADTLRQELDRTEVPEWYSRGDVDERLVEVVGIEECKYE